MDEHSFQEALKSGLSYLRTRPRSVNEVVEKLRKKHVANDVVDRVILELERCGYLNDEDFSRRWIEGHLHRSGGPQKFAYDLRKKGIAQDTIDAIITEFAPQLNSRDRAIELLRKQLWRYKSVERRKARSRMYGFLARRGYDAYAVDEIVDMFCKELEQDEVTRS
ncbi:MAG: regulatory protein RecX [Candidatus Latescibacterota bacterium]|nr:regulatory protein RecX [Candidatus Latescibacterota bacterium]